MSFKSQKKVKSLISLLNDSQDSIEVSPFLYFLTRLGDAVVDINLEYLHEIWGIQGGICAITGCRMIPPDDVRGWRQDSPKNAVLSKIRTLGGYTRGNVRFISVMATHQ